MVWNIGGSSTYDDVTSSLFYERERGTVVYDGKPATWIGNVGLMYPSDYGYATDGGSLGRQLCLSDPLYNWNNYSDCYESDWLFRFSNHQWSISSLSTDSIYAFNIRDNGIVSRYIVNGIRLVSPVVFLNSSIKIISGTGSSSDPYQLSL